MALSKLQSFCAYQERCQLEVVTKLRELGFVDEVAESIIDDLITDNFLNEERFAVSYARGKFRIKAWGKVRIRQELKMRLIPDKLIKQALEAVDTEGGYFETLEKIVAQKQAELAPDDPHKTEKILNLALRRGFEADLIWQVLKKSI